MVTRKHWRFGVKQSEHQRRHGSDEKLRDNDGNVMNAL